MDVFLQAGEPVAQLRYPSSFAVLQALGKLSLAQIHRDIPTGVNRRSSCETQRSEWEGGRVGLAGQKRYDAWSRFQGQQAPNWTKVYRYLVGLEIVED